MDKPIYCEQCRYYNVEGTGDSHDWFLFHDCKSPENEFVERDWRTERTIKKEPSELNKMNDCKYFLQADMKIIEMASGHFRGPWEYYQEKESKP